jgi:hypothetical protein
MEGIGRPLSLMSAITERRGIHGSTAQDAQPIHAIDTETHNVIIYMCVCVCVCVCFCMFCIGGGARGSVDG